MSDFKRAFLPPQTVFTDEANVFSVLPTAPEVATEGTHLVNLNTLQGKIDETGEKIDKTKADVIAQTQQMIDAVKLGRSYKGEVGTSVETIAERKNIGTPGDSMTVLVWGDGEHSGSYQRNGLTWERLPNAAKGSVADGALWYVRDTKQLWAVEGDGVSFGEKISIGKASPPLDISGDGAVQVINGRVGLNPLALEINGPDEIRGSNLKVAYAGPLLGKQNGTLNNLVQQIERNQRREYRPLSFVLTKEDVEAAKGEVVAATDSIPTGFVPDSERVASVRVFGGGKLKAADFKLTLAASRAGSHMLVTLSAEIVDMLKKYPETYYGEVIQPIIPEYAFELPVGEDLHPVDPLPDTPFFNQGFPPPAP